MKKVKHTTAYKLLSVILSAVMVLSTIPFSAISVFAGDLPEMEGISVQSAGDLKYNGEEQDLAVTVTGAPEGSTFQYSSSLDGPWSSDFPKKKEVNTEGYPVYVKVLNSNYEDFPVEAPALVKINKGEMTGVSVQSAGDLKYNGKKQALAVKVNGVPEGSTFQYRSSSDGLWSNDLPEKTEVNTEGYPVYVKVLNSNYNDFPIEAPALVKINKGEITGVTVTPKKDIKYKDKEGWKTELVEVSGTQKDDTILYSTTGEAESWTTEEPTGNEPGPYSVYVKVQRENYEDKVFDKLEVMIQNGKFDVDIKTPTLTYTGNPQALIESVTVNDPEKGYTISYSTTGEDESWGPDVPTGTDAGSYTVYVKLDVESTKYDSETYMVNVAIGRANQDLKFVTGEYNPKDNKPAEVSLDLRTYDFSAQLAEGMLESGEQITYSVSNKNVASIDAKGNLTISAADTFTVTAKKEGNDNFNESTISAVVSVKTKATVNFENKELSYVFGTSVDPEKEGIISQQKLTNKNAEVQNGQNDDGAITYAIVKGELSSTVDDSCGVQINAESGELSISDYKALANSLINAKDNKVNVVVKATKAETDYYGEGSATYTVTIEFAEMPTNDTPYSLSGIKNTEDNSWYVGDITVKPAVENYSIYNSTFEDGAYSFDKYGFGQDFSITADGAVEKYIFLKNNTTGGITNMVTIPAEKLKKDAAAPVELSISYKEPEVSWLKKIFHFNSPENQTVTMTFTATDKNGDAIVSGLDRVEWTYTHEDNVSESNVEGVDGKLDFENGNDSVSLTLPEKVAGQYRGHISFTVYDKAGNSTKYTPDGEIIVVDTVSPTMTVEYDEAVNAVDSVRYYNTASAKATFTVTEANFDSEDVNVTATKDGKPIDTVDLSWKDNSVDEHVGTLTFSGDGHYDFTVAYKDKSGNEMKEYTSNTMVIDTTMPVIDVQYDKPLNNTGRTYLQNKQIQKATITITERNFDAQKVELNIVAQDVAGNNVAGTTSTEEWKSVGNDQYVKVVTFNGDANYTFNLTCSDLAKNEAKKRNNDEFTVDTTDPEIQSVKYSESLQDAVLSGITCGFYNDKVTVTVTAFDATSGVNSFNYSYILADGVSGVNAGMESGAPETITYSPDGKTATMEFYVPEKALTANNQFNGTVKITAVDLSGNSSEKKDSYRLVVDNLAPKATVTFNKPVATVGGVDYYNGAIKGTITITEANFDSKGVEVVVSKNGTNLTAAVSWTDNDVDTHVGTFTLSDDADYVVGVKYTDKSDNAMTPFLSGKMTVDTTKPKATVTFNDAVNTTGGVAYYNGALKGTITVTDANFDAKSIKVVATKNGAAETPAVSWTDTNRNLHVGTFTLSADADYVINITGTDKATNAMTPYKSGKMTVDTEIENPTFTINGKACKGESGAYNGDVTVGYSFFDQNFSSKEIELIRYRFDEKKVVTEDFVQVTLNDKGGVGSFDIPKTTDNDGIYVLKLTMTDKAGHISGDKSGDNLVFTVNRFGSVYQYDDYLCALIANGGQYKQVIDQDLIVTEYNASEQAVGSLKIMITRDGESIEVIEPKTSLEHKGNSWYKYTYVISKDNFTKDGFYKITISSKDVNGNDSTSVPDDPAKKIKGNTVNVEGEAIQDTMTFTVDNTAPEIRNIANLEKAIVDKSLIKDGKLEVPFSVVDAGGLAKIEIYVNGDLVDTIDTFENINAYDGSFFINESTDIQKVRLVVTDLAGKVTDTLSEDFDPGNLFVFNDEVTVSTDFFVRFYRNAPLFWGSIGGVAAVAAGIILLIAKKKKKKDDKKA